MSEILEKNKLDINTLEGWNEFVRQGNINALIERGVDPTEENLTNYQEEVNQLVKELEKQYPPKEVPTVYTVGDRSFDTEEAALEYKESIKSLEDEADKIIKIFSNHIIQDIPYEQIAVLNHKVKKQFKIWGDYGTFGSIYLLGRIDGIRAERARRKTSRNTRFYAKSGTANQTKSQISEIINELSEVNSERLLAFAKGLIRNSDQ